MVREWRQSVVAVLRKSMPMGVATVLSTVVVFASTGGLTGGELVIAGGSAVLGQKLLETIFGEDAVRRLAKLARDDLGRRVEALLQGEGDRYRRLLDPVRSGSSPQQMRADSDALANEVARSARSDAWR